MKQLYLLRHAKSCWKSDFSCDHSRHLNKRGYRAAAKIGKRFAEMQIQPDLVLCSTATRAQETFSGIVEAGGFEWNMKPEPRLYGASANTILAIIKEYGPAVNNLMIIGHNPGLEDAAMALSTKGKKSLFDRLYHKVPTGSFISIEFDVPCFSDVSARSGKLIDFMRPKIEFA